MNGLKKIGVLAVLLCGLSLLAATPAEATHFRYGILTWQLTGDIGEVRFVFTAAFRRNAPQYGSFPGGIDEFAEIGDIIEENVGGTGLNFGDGSSTGTLRFEVTAFSVEDNLIIARALNPGTNNPGIVHTYGNTNRAYSAVIADCCRISSLNNRPDGNYRLATTVTFDGNVSPISSMVPIAVVDESATASFFVPASDPNGDELRWRIGESSEVGGGPNPPNISVNPTTGRVTWNNVGLTQSSVWTVQVIVEDLDQNGDVRTQVPIDFFLKIRPKGSNTPPNCVTSPLGPFAIDPGESLSFEVIATDVDPGATVTLNSSGLPPGATMTPSLPVSGASGTSSTFSWTPAVAFIGIYDIVYLVVDDEGAQGACLAQVAVGEDATRPICGAIMLEFDGPNGEVSALNTSARDPDTGIASVAFTRLNNVVGFAEGAGPFTQGDLYTTLDPNPEEVAIRAERISFDVGGEFVVTVQNGGGLTSRCDPVVSQLSATVPDAFALGAAYPNPFRPSAGSVRIPFALAEAGAVRVAVYDMLGREVAVLIDEDVAPGSYEAAWSGADARGQVLAAGAYVVRLESESFSETQQVLIVR